MAVAIKKIEEALIEAKGNVSAAAKALGLARSSVYERIEKTPNLKTILDDARETRVDTAEDKLGEAVDKGEAWAVCFTLKTQGKSRGYTEKTEVEQSGTINHNVSGEVMHTIQEIYGNDGESGSN